MWEETNAVVVSLFVFYYNEKLLQCCTSTQAPTYRRLQPSLILQHPLEGSSNPLISFTDTHHKGSLTPYCNLLATTRRKLRLPY